MGHTVTIFVVGAGIILSNLVIPARVGLSMELSVGIMLVVLGIMNVAAFLRSIPGARLAAQNDAPLYQSTVHSHSHSHGDYIHSHQHAHEPDVHLHGTSQAPLALLDRMLAKFGVYHHLRPLAVGIVHGLAGSAAVALLVLTTIRNPYWAIAYLLVFGIGTIAGMMVITMSLASTIKFAGKSQHAARKLGMASGLLSLAFGLLVVYQIGFVSGLFTAHPRWTPR